MATNATTKQCPQCRGEGELYDEGEFMDDCDNCDGTGRVCIYCNCPRTECECDDEPSSEE